MERRLQAVMMWATGGFAVVIAAMLWLLFPDAPRQAREALRDPARDLPAPFQNCAAAHAAGFYSIPADSPAYATEQDADLDGYACEPVHGGGPMDGLRRVARKLAAGRGLSPEP